MVLGSSYTFPRQIVGIEALDKDEKSGDSFRMVMHGDGGGDGGGQNQTAPQIAEKRPNDF